MGKMKVAREPARTIQPCRHGLDYFCRNERLNDITSAPTMSSKAVGSTAGIITSNKNWVRFAKTCARLSALRLCRLPKAQAWSSTVFVDELHASFLEGSSYDIEGRATWLAPLLFEMVDGHDANARSISQVLLAPT
jgi:hypothetical protein